MKDAQEIYRSHNRPKKLYQSHDLSFATLSLIFTLQEPGKTYY